MIRLHETSINAATKELMRVLPNHNMSLQSLFTLPKNYNETVTLLDMWLLDSLTTYKFEWKNIKYSPI